MQQGFSSIHKNREFLGIDSSFCKTDCIFGMASICRTCIEETLRRQFDFYDWDGSALANHDYPWLFMTHEGGRIRITNPSGQSAPIDYAGPRPPTMDRWRRQQKGEDFPVWGRWNGIDEILLRMFFQVCKGIWSSLQCTQLEIHLLLLRQFQPSSACKKASPPSRARYSIKF